MEYKLLRSKRKTLAIHISGGSITVKAPNKMSIEHIERFIEQKSAWIEKKLNEYAVRAGFLSALSDCKRMMYRGEFYDAVEVDVPSRVHLSNGMLCIPKRYGTDSEKQRAVIAFFKRLAKIELAAELDTVSKEVGLVYNSFALTNARTKWGSCDGKGNIRLNWRLIMLDPQLMRYVIVHELSHTKHHDHSAAFWAEVGKHMPSYSAVKKRLKQFSALTSLYR